MYKLLGTYQEELEKQTINHDLFFFQLCVSMLLEHLVWMVNIVANFSENLRLVCHRFNCPKKTLSMRVGHVIPPT